MLLCYLTTLIGYVVLFYNLVKYKYVVLFCKDYELQLMTLMLGSLHRLKRKSKYAVSCFILVVHAQSYI